MARKASAAKKPTVILTANQLDGLTKVYDEMPRRKVDCRALTPLQLAAVVTSGFATHGEPFIAEDGLTDAALCRAELARRILTGELIENK